MMEFKTLAQTPVDDILDCFNKSFSDYLVPLQLTGDQMLTKIRSEDIQLQHSVGAFIGQELIGFILHGVREHKGKKRVYNAGTGVVPAHRGKKITRALYDFVLPSLKELPAASTSLEVINGNYAAYKIYLDTGFKTTRLLNAYKGQIQTGPPTDHSVDLLTNWDWERWTSFWDCTPAWQYSIRSLENIKEILTCLAITIEGNTLAYLIFNAQTKRICQFAVHKAHRNQGLGTALFHYLGKHYGPAVSIINVDASSTDTNRFLKSKGLGVFIQLNEMELALL